MMSECWILEITVAAGDGFMTTGASAQRCTFTTKELAVEQLRLIEPKIGQKRQNDLDKIRHTVIASDGELIIDSGCIVSARLIDLVAFEKNHDADHANRRDRHKSWLKELMAEGLIAGATIKETSI